MIYDLCFYVLKIKVYLRSWLLTFFGRIVLGRNVRKVLILSFGWTFAWILVRLILWDLFFTLLSLFIIVILIVLKPLDMITLCSQFNCAFFTICICWSSLRCCLINSYFIEMVITHSLLSKIGESITKFCLRLILWLHLIYLFICFKTAVLIFGLIQFFVMNFCQRRAYHNNRARGFDRCVVFLWVSRFLNPKCFKPKIRRRKGNLVWCQCFPYG